MSIYKRGKSWYVDFVFNSARINRKVADTKTAAKRIEEELKTKLRLKLLNISDLTNTAEHIMFHLVAEEYIVHVENTKSKRYTYEIRLHYNNHIKDFFSPCTLTDISNDLFIKYQSLKKSQTLIPFKEMRKAARPHVRIKGHKKRSGVKKEDSQSRTRLFDRIANLVYPEFRWIKIEDWMEKRFRKNMTRTPRQVAGMFLMYSKMNTKMKPKMIVLAQKVKDRLRKRADRNK